MQPTEVPHNTDETELVVKRRGRSFDLDARSRAPIGALPSRLFDALRRYRRDRRRKMGFGRVSHRRWRVSGVDGQNEKGEEAEKLTIGKKNKMKRKSSGKGLVWSTSRGLRYETTPRWGIELHSSRHLRFVLVPAGRARSARTGSRVKLNGFTSSAPI